MDISSLTQSLPSLKSLKNKVNAGALIATGFCLFDFADVPQSFKLDYNAKGEKVEGTNWKSGLKELGKSAIKCASFLVVPALLSGAAVTLGPLAASLVGIASFGSGFALSSVLEKLLPHEKEVVAEACKEKGILLDGNVKPESMMQIA